MDIISNILTHTNNNNSTNFDDLDKSLLECEQRLELLEKNSEISSTQKTKYQNILKEFSEFNLGKFIIKNRGLNGFWADYLINYPEHYKKTLKDPLGEDIKNFEQILLEKLPVTTATQERHKIFIKLAQSKIKNNNRVLSMPCGLSSELLHLDYSNINNIELIGIDIDPESLELSKQRAIELDLNKYCTWLECDAWQFPIDKPCDLILSNGLTMYVNDDELVKNLYSRFYQGLKPSGLLITSYITPPPYINKNSSWNIENIDAEFLEVQETLFHKIFNSKWHGYRSDELTVNLLKQAGFSQDKIEIHHDKNNIFPTVTAYK